MAETALAIAREKADDRGIDVEFAAADVFQLERLGRMFQTVLDCGLPYGDSTWDRRMGMRAPLLYMALTLARREWSAPLAVARQPFTLSY